MGQAAIGSDSICDNQKGHGEPRGNEEVLYVRRHSYEMKYVDLSDD